MFAKLVSTVALVTSVGVLGACSDDDDVDDPVMPRYGSAVNVTLEEYEVNLSPSSVNAGLVTFSIYNQGDEIHEFVVVQTALAVEDLPTTAAGAFDEEGAGVEVVDEIEVIAPGGTVELTLSLEAGPYVLLCNRVVPEGDEIESHFHEGMHVPFSVQQAPAGPPPPGY